MAVKASSRIAFRVSGTPVTKGSLRQWHMWRADGRCITGISEQQGERLKAWRGAVAMGAAAAMRDAPPFAGPVAVGLAFWFPLPTRATPATHAGMPYAVVRGRNDLDKLTRAILDACTDAAVWGDDSQVAELTAVKRYVQLPGDSPGVFVTVEVLR